MNDRNRTMCILKAGAEAHATKLILDELRAGRSKNAIELLEHKLDATLVIVNGLAKFAGPAECLQLEPILRDVREYRRRYPRKSDGSGGSDESLLNPS